MNRTTQISKTNGRYFLLLGNARTALAAFSVFAPLMAYPSTASALSLFTSPPHHVSVNEEETSHEEAKKPSFPKMDYGAESTYAFPGCVGHGRLTRGARAGKNIKLYKVTNLNSDGPGSFKDAISQPNRIIVFGVAGVLDLNRETYRLKDNQTILFETAPGDGIELYNGRVSSSSCATCVSVWVANTTNATRAMLAACHQVSTRCMTTARSRGHATRTSPSAVTIKVYAHTTSHCKTPSSDKAS